MSSFYPPTSEVVVTHFGSPPYPTYGIQPGGVRGFAVCQTCGALVPIESHGIDYIAIHAQHHDREAES